MAMMKTIYTEYMDILTEISDIVENADQRFFSLDDIMRIGYIIEGKHQSFNDKYGLKFSWNIITFGNGYIKIDFRLFHENYASPIDWHVWCFSYERVTGTLVVMKDVFLNGLASYMEEDEEIEEIELTY